MSRSCHALVLRALCKHQVLLQHMRMITAQFCMHAGLLTIQVHQDSADPGTCIIIV